MNIDGRCHLRPREPIRPEIDPKRVSICHCTDCQNADRIAPNRVTVICSEEQIRMTGQAPKIYAKTGDKRPDALSAFSVANAVPPLFYQRRGRP